MLGSYSQPVVPITAGNGGGFGNDNSFFWVFALLILGGGGLGGFGGNRGGVPEVTGFQLGELSGRVADKDSIATLQNSTNQGFAGLNTAISNGLSTTTFEIVNRIGLLSTQLAQCCCDIRYELSQGFGAVKYDMANFASATNANIADWGNKILSQLANDKAQAQAQRINQLELNQALCGVVRYPNQSTYNAGGSPFCNNCNCY